MDINHKMELMSIAMATTACATAGCTWSHAIQDFGIDLNIHGPGWDMDPQIDAQLKSTTDFSIIKRDDDVIKYPLRVKNYKDLIRDSFKPRILILAILPENPEQWVQERDLELSLQYGIFWVNLKGMAPTDLTSKITVTLPYENRFNGDTLKNMMNQLNENGELSQ